MLKVQGYKNLQEIQERATTIIYRGLREQDQKPVIIKILKHEYPSLEAITRLKHEYEITKNLDRAGIIKPFSLENNQNGLALILEDFGGQSLQELIALGNVEMGDFLNLAIQLASSLAYLHENNIIHKDIKPENLIVNPETGSIKITDFSIASRLSRESPTISNPNLLEGTLAYMSPEQTGRMNRCLDYRTDFYSLGVTFYEMLVGQLPFQSTDPLELIHCHIAKTPIPPHELNPEIPLVISEILLKLIAKTAENRYQSALGLKADLETCLAQLKSTGKIANFPVGQVDLSGQLLVPQKLYGREQEVAKLIAAFERVSVGATEMMLVSGYSGIGKTSVINEVHKPIIRQRGYFITGKFDQFKRNIPYASLIQAFQSLMRQLLTESTENLENWKQKLLEALGQNSQIIVDVIPELELIIGKQPEVIQLAPPEAQHRFNRVFQQFIHVFSKPEHPLILFLDDLQWADSASLKLMQQLITDPDSKYLLLIGAYRDNEVTPSHPFIQTVNEIKQTDRVLNHISIQPLDLSDVTQLIADTLYHNTEQVKPLAELIYQQTSGNPFFLTQLLQSLYQENLLTFDFSPLIHEQQQGGWQWNLEKIQAIGIADNSVVQLVASQIKKLPKATQEVLKLAACIGNRFTLDVLSTVNAKSPSVTATELYPALQSGLILPLNPDYKIPLFLEEDNEELIQSKIHNLLAQRRVALSKIATVGYKFLHDRVQQAAYSLIPESQKKATHQQIGQLLLKNTQPEELQANIFDIVNQLNVAIALMRKSPEIAELARLNLIAGCKAKAATAYESALKYLMTGVDLLRQDCWQNNYELTLTLYEEAAEAAYLNGEFEQMQKLAEIVLQKAKNIIDQVKIYEVKILTYIAQNRLAEAVATGLEALQLLGISFPDQPTETDIGQALGKTASLVSETGIEDLINLPPMTDIKSLAALRILSTINSATYFVSPKLYTLNVLSMVNLSIAYGNTVTSTFAYATYGLILCGVANDIESGYRFGKLAINLSSQSSDKKFYTKVLFIAATLIVHWKSHLRESLPLFQSAYENGLEIGDLEYTAWSYYHECQALYSMGLELDTLECKIATYSHAIRQSKQELVLSYINRLQQVVLNLMEFSAEPCCLVGEIYNETQFLPQYQAVNNRSALFYLYSYKQQLCYLFGNYLQAIENATLAANYLDGVASQYIIPVLYFYDSLAHLAIYYSLADPDQTRVLEKVKFNQKKLNFWAYYAPMNYLHKVHLVEAEKYRVIGLNFQAMDEYDRAIQGAAEHGYIQEEALANERAAEFYLTLGKEKIAKTYMTDAYYGYIRWGAKAKVRDLEQKYPQLISQKIARENYTINQTKVTANSTEKSTELLDLASVIKASQAISGQIVLENLLDKLMKILLENAAAQKGFLILGKAGKLTIEAAANVDKNEVVVLQSLSIETSHDMPSSIINYVARTREDIVLNHAIKEGMFTTDSYILNNQPLSVLCAPILYQGELTAIIYLENNLSVGAFTQQRLELLKLLTSQIAISIENAWLYRTLEQKVEERTCELTEKNEELSTTLQKLKTMQNQIIAQEKLASLGALTSGIAHEIKNPLNFVTNFAELSIELIQELRIELENPKESLDDSIIQYTKSVLNDLEENAAIINKHGKRADSIVRGMLAHSRGGSSEREFTDINALLVESVQLAYHGMRAKYNTFNINLETDYDESIGWVEIVPQDISRVFINILNNACYAVKTKKQELGEAFEPCLSVKTLDLGNVAEIKIKDNGSGIPPDQLDKIFHPFFTTKPTGEGTGLGLSISQEIIVGQHGGEIKVETELGLYTEFIIVLLKQNVEN